METAQCGPEGPLGPKTGFGCATFNQDATSLALGTHSGFRLFSLTNVDMLDCIYHSTVNSLDVGVVERLYGSSLVVVVSAQTPQHLHIYHFKKGTEICNYNYPKPVHAVKLNRQRLVACLEGSLYIHNIKDMKLLQTLVVPSNPCGLCALSSSGSCSYLAYPHCPNTGELQVYDATALTPVTVIPAHHSPLAALSFNTSASRLASASRKGTVIRVFSIPQGHHLFEFRRGMKRCVDISCLSFSPDGHFLCSSSNTETVHVFRLEHPNASLDQEVDSSWGSYMGRMFSAASSYLPAPVSHMMSQERAFATAQLPRPSYRNTCALAVIQKLPRLLVATSDSILYVFTFDPAEGGKCQLSHTHQLLEELQGQSEGRVWEASDWLGPVTPCPTYAATAALPPAPSLTPGLTAATLTESFGSGVFKLGECEHPRRLGEDSRSSLLPKLPSTCLPHTGL
ncbi:WD repeat domain phosphoinositide-interacting protein 1 isoform X2 [Boleophthalmus pectinirostris]|uniref:WD repeat domain phosphoinositide-interacting protein 1 isoform X2 n=1 Tax=Boleophthalmus pectinirostris TaxID=150288 RepID=UPI00242E00B7|nr:WD repeat domain phosphoinositide-interacting protein 1 isoform X2 [Boleophthalmus pectinirostris]